MKYRDHKGGLSASLETTREILSINELKEHLNSFFKHYGKEVEEIKFEHIGIDERTGWDTFYVLQRLKNESDFTIAGMSDGQL